MNNIIIKIAKVKMKRPLKIQQGSKFKKFHAVLTYNNYVFDKMDKNLKFTGCINGDNISDQPLGQLICCAEKRAT